MRGKEYDHMNYDNLHELVSRYEEKTDILDGTDHYELFKWKHL